MKLSEFSIHHHVFAWMLMVGLLVFGSIAFMRMGVSQLPDINFPVVSISVTYDGASPEVMELSVVDVLEGSLTLVPGIQVMTSSSKMGAASISLEFGINKDIDLAVQEVEAALAGVQKQLPSNVDPPIVTKTNPEDQPILQLAVTAEHMSRPDLMKLVRDQVQDRFTMVDGVGQIILGGYLAPNLRVWLSQEKLNKFELTASDVIQAIRLGHSEQPGGRIETPSEEIHLRTLGEAYNLKDFENIAITRRGGGVNYCPIALKNVAFVEDATVDVRSIGRAQGKVAVGLGITKQSGTNAVAVAKAVKLRMKEVAVELPEGVEIGVRFDTTLFIEEAVDELNFTLVFSAILTAIVCWIFLGSWSATLNVILAIPTSIIGCFIGLYVLGFTLNTFTLLGLSLAIGIVVDDAIMVLENIVRHQQQGKDRVRASLDGATEITGAAIAATFAIIAIFLPVTLMDGIIGKYFLQFGLTLSVAVLISLLEALILTPMRCSRFLVVSPRVSWGGAMVEHAFETATKVYQKMIPVAVHYPWRTLLLAIIFFLLSLRLGGMLKREFVPAQDQSRLMVRLQAPIGSSLPLTDRTMREIEKYFFSRPEVLGQFASIGAGSGAAVNIGNIFLTLKPPHQRSLSAQQLAMEFRKDLKKMEGMKITVLDPSLSELGASRSFPVQFTIKGSDWGVLIDISNKVTQAMELTGLMTDIDTNYLDGMPEIQIIPHRARARQYGVEISEISTIVNAMMAGAIAGQYAQGGRRYDVRVSLPASARTSIETLRNMKIRNTQGELVPLYKVATFEKRHVLQSISREDRQRAITVRANLIPGSSQAAAIDAVQDIMKRTLPDGYSAVVSGSAKTFQESFQGLFFALILGILVSYMVLASQLNSFIHPITILMSLPFSVSGACIALYLGKQTLNIYSMIGVILLMGIVKKNAILLVDFTNHLRMQGMDASEALWIACPTRLRPILMTSIATIVGALPAALSLGPGAESRVSMSLGIIGGVFVATFLTLFVVPSVYTILDRFSHKSG